MKYLFYNCYNLTYVDISSFSSNSNSTISLFNNKVPKLGVIKLTTQFYNKIKDNSGISNWTFDIIDL